ncbi:MAG: trigger factor [Chloroflexota bacterium]|nr:trigger factor [Chloroflexota bacterium]
MKVTTETTGPRKVTLTVEPDEQMIEQGLRRAAHEISQIRPVEGFRPGRAPYRLVQRIYGRETVLNEALREIAPRIYGQAVEEAGIEPLEPGEFEVESQDPVVLKMDISLVPKVELGDYMALHIEPEPEVAITEEQIQQELERVQREHAEYEPVDRPVQVGDQIVASVEGISEGELVIDEESTSLDVTHDLMPPGFAEALLGMGAGESREFSLTYPKDFENEELAGKYVDFAVTVNTVRQVNLPELDDDLAKMAGDYETLDELRASLMDSLRQQLEAEAREREAGAAIEALMKASKVEYPEAAVEREVEAVLRNQRARIERSGLTFEHYLRMAGQSEQDLATQIRPEVEERLIRTLVIQEFIRAEGVTVDEEELEKEMTRMVGNFALITNQEPEDIRERLQQNGTQFSMKNDLLMQKATDLLVDILTGRHAKDKEESQEDTVKEGKAPSEESSAPED